MKKLLLPSIIALLAVPGFADNEPTPLPNNALCNEDNLGTTSGSADIEVIWEPNTITTQWYTGYGANTAVTNATTCDYGGTINLPQTNPSRPGYAFNGWKLRTPQCSLSGVDTSVNGTAYAAMDGTNFGIERGSAGGATLATYGLTAIGDFGVTFNYGIIKGIAFCTDTSPEGIDELETAVMNEEITLEEGLALLYGNNGLAIRPANAFTINDNGTGASCWCRVSQYTPSGSQQCVLTNTPWAWEGGIYGDGDNVASCLHECASNCAAMIYSYSGDDPVNFREIVYRQ